MWFQVVQHRNPTVTGLLLLPYLFGLVFVGIVYAFLLRQSSKVLSILLTDNHHRKRLILIIGGILFLIGITLISTLVHKLPLGALMVVLLLFGAGSGLGLQTSFLEAQAAVSPNGVYSSLNLEQRDETNVNGFHLNYRYSNDKFLCHSIRISRRCRRAHHLQHNKPFKPGPESSFRSLQACRKSMHPTLFLSPVRAKSIRSNRSPSSPRISSTRSYETLILRTPYQRRQPEKRFAGLLRRLCY